MTEAKIVLSAEDRASRVLKSVQGELSVLQTRGQALASVLGGPALFGGLAGLASAGVLGGLKSLVGSLDDLAESAAGLQVGAVALDQFRAAAVQGGVDAAQLDAALTKLNVKVSDAASGNEEAARLFAGLGVAIKDAAGQVRSTEAIYADVADAFVRLQEGPAKAAIAVEIFGKAGAKLIPVLNGGSDALRRNTGLTEDAVKQAERLATEWDKAGLAFSRAKNALVGELLPGINRVLAALTAVQLEDTWLGRLRQFASGDLQRQAKRAFDTLAEADRLFGNVTSSASTSAATLNGQKILEEARRKSASATKAEKDAIDDNTRAFARYVEELDKATRAGEELSRVAEAQRAIDQGRFGVLIPQQQELILLLAAEADARALAVRQTKELADAEAALDRERQSLEKDVLGFAGVLDEQRKVSQTAALERLIASGTLTDPAKIEAAVKGIAGIKDELDKTSDAAEQFALVMTSALSDFFKNPRDAKSFFKALEADIMQLITQLLVLKPLAEAIKGTFASGDLVGSFAGAFGNAGSGLGKLFESIPKLFAGLFADGGFIRPGQWGIVDEAGPELAFGGRSGQTIVPAARMAGGGHTINITVAGGTTRESAYQIGAEVSRALARANARYN